MKTLFLIPILWLFSTALNAQINLKGTVQDSLGKALPFVSVAVLKMDSSLVKASATNEQGEFYFEKISSGKYIIRAFSVGFLKKYTQVFEVHNEDLTLPKLLLFETTTQLKEVQITTKRPFIEQQIDRMVVNVANSIVGSGSTALEVLTKAPGITVDFQREQIELRGKDGVAVQIDGKLSYLSGSDLVGMLRSMSSDNIDKIEIITNPSARYDAAGNSGIINIRLKKNVNLGTNGLFTLGVGTGQHYRSRSSLQLNHRSEKLNIFGNYSINKGANFWDLNLERNQPDGNLRNYVNQKTHLIFDDLGQNVKAGMDYSLSKNTTIGIVWTGFWTNHNEDGNADFETRRFSNEPIYFQTTTQKTFYTNSQNQLGNLNFQHNFKNKSQVSADLDIGHFKKDNNNDLNTNALILENGVIPPVAQLINATNSNIDFLTLKADYSLPLSKIWKIETGFKYAKVMSVNDVRLRSGEKDNIVIDPNLSSHFEYDEQVKAGYVSFSGKLNKIELQAGLRVEHTHSEGNLTVPSQIKTRDYLNWFPSLFLSKPISEKENLIFSYSYRIDRPNYQNLNPARGFVDLYAVSQGNIDLRPQYTHALELRYAHKSGFFGSLASNFISDWVLAINNVTDGNKVIRQSQNLGDAQSYILTAGMPFTVSKAWQIQTSFLGLYNQFQFDFEGKSYNTRNFSGRLNFSNGFTFGYGWTAELNGWVNSPSINTIQEMPWLSNFDTGLQKVVNQKIKVKLSLQNIFFTPVLISEMNGAMSYQKARLQLDTRIVMLNINYIFGNQKVKASRQRKSGADDESKRAN
jgi:Outer membrane protein beta-barrel family/Carboxypeptidase regulatory-like domain